MTGGSRLFLANDKEFAPSTVRSWKDISYRKLALLGQQLSFSVDMSKVGCGCNGAVYLVAMDEASSHIASGYCDIQGYDIPDVAPCVELDLIEGNRKACQATQHTQQGRGQNGRCNQDGCEGNWGRDGSTKLFGPGSGNIDSNRPFRVTATFPRTAAGAAYNVRVSQGSDDPLSGMLLLDANGAANLPHGRPPVPVSEDDQRKTRIALEHGLVLVVSLWTAPDLVCRNATPHTLQHAYHHLRTTLTTHDPPHDYLTTHTLPTHHAQAPMPRLRRTPR